MILLHRFCWVQLPIDTLTSVNKLRLDNNPWIRYYIALGHVDVCTYLYPEIYILANPCGLFY